MIDLSTIPHFAPLVTEWKRTHAEDGDTRTFNQWLQGFIEDNNAKDWAQDVAKELENQDLGTDTDGWGAFLAKTLPDQYEVVGGDGETVPLEQGLLQQALPSLTADVANDAQRRTIADQLAQQALAGQQSATGLLARTQGGHFGGEPYFQHYPDVAQAYAALPNGAVPNTKSLNGKDVTADQYAEWHYTNYGQAEGRTPSYIQSPQLAQDFNNANQTTAANIAASNQATGAQLQALGEATAAMQQNLTGDLAVKAAALQQQLGELYQNLDQLDATQRQALIDQVTAQQQNLDESIATQRQALATQIASLQGAAGAQADAQRASLQKELDGLTAAQAPLNAARTQAAQLQATAVNVGLERTKDQLTADNARAGYIGGSTGQDANLARATIDARQKSAEAIAGARLANEQDTRDIGVRGATGERTIADALASAQNLISQQGANSTAGLTVAGAQGKQALGDTKATGLAAITNNTGVSKAGIGAYGANTNYGNVTTGADQARTIADSLAQGTYGLKSNNAQNILAANQAGNAAKATYYDNDYSRSLAAALAMPSMAGATANTLKGLDDYATSGLGRTQNLLSWWQVNPNPAPTAGAIAQQADTSANGFGAIGAGLVNFGLNKANDWWKTQKPATTTIPTTQDPYTGD